MDRYFYSVEMDGDRKVVHVSGNVHFNDVDETETCYRVANWTFLYITLDELMDMMPNELEFFDYVNSRVDYLLDITEHDALNICETYWGGEPGVRLPICDVNEDTPCGYYWFE